MTVGARTHRPARGFLAVLAVLMAVGLAMFLSVIWTAAYVSGGSATLYINQMGEAGVELVMFYAVVWPVMSVGLYFLAVDEVAA